MWKHLQFRHLKSFSLATLRLLSEMERGSWGDRLETGN